MTLAARLMPCGQVLNPCAYALSFEELAALVGSYGSLIHFIRLQATVSLLSKYIPISNTPNPGLYKYKVGDALLIVTLKSPQRGQDMRTVTENDVELFLVSVGV